jgi:hypothetical protein
MRSFLRFMAVVLLVSGSLVSQPPRAYAASLDTTAVRVFGQPDFTHNTINNGGLSATSLQNPWGAALDTKGNLYVADSVNNRVLE